MCTYERENSRAKGYAQLKELGICELIFFTLNKLKDSTVKFTFSQRNYVPKIVRHGKTRAKLMTIIYNNRRLKFD